MVPLKKLRKITITEDFRDVYKHYLEQEGESIEAEYNKMLYLLDVSQTDVKSSQINQEIKLKTSLAQYTERVYHYFLRILYVCLKSFNEPFSVRACIKDALGYATAEYLAASVLKCIS